MKVITADTHWNIDKLYTVLKEKLNALFAQHRQTSITFNIERKGDCILISQPQMYEGYLFNIEARGNELYVGKSEHYVDDVNQLTLQSILETLQMDYKDGEGIINISGE